MKIYKRIDGEYEEVASVSPHGEVTGDSALANDLKEELDGDGMYIPGLHDDKEKSFASEGTDLLIYLENRFSTGYYSASFEEGDLEELAELSDDIL